MNVPLHAKEDLACRRDRENIRLDAASARAKADPVGPHANVFLGRAGVAQKMVPAYRVHAAKRLAYVRLSGRMIYLGKAGSVGSQEKYRRVVAEWLVTGRAPQRKDQCATVLTVAALGKAYLQWARGYYRDADGGPSSGLGPVEAAVKGMINLYGNTPAVAFGPVALRAVRQQMIDADLCRNVINGRVACIKRVYRWAIAEELIPASTLTALAAIEPLRHGRSGARESKPIAPVPDAHVDAVLPFLPPSLRAAVQLQRLTGMRSGELCILRPIDLDRLGAVWTYRPRSHKTMYRGHERVVRIGPRAQEILRTLLDATHPEHFAFSPMAAQRQRQVMRRGEHGPNTALTVGADDDLRRYNPRSYHRALRYAMFAAQRSGVLQRSDFWHPHQLRHANATEIRRQRGLEAARVVLGHRSVDQTLDYAEADQGLAESVAADLG